MSDRTIKAPFSPFSHVPMARRATERHPIDKTTVADRDDGFEAFAPPAPAFRQPQTRNPFVGAQPRDSTSSRNNSLHASNKPPTTPPSPPSEDAPSTAPTTPQSEGLQEAREAAKKGDVDALEQLLEGAAPGFVNAVVDEQGSTLLHLVAEYAPRPKKALAFLLSRGAAPVMQDGWLESPLVALVRRGPEQRGTEAVECIRMVLQHGANPNATNHSGRTVFHDVIMAWPHGPETVLQALIDNDLDLNQPSSFGERPLYIVARSCRRPAPVLKMLLQAHATKPHLRADPNLTSVCPKARGRAAVEWGPPLLAAARYAVDPMPAMIELVRYGASIEESLQAMERPIGLQGTEVRDSQVMEKLLLQLQAEGIEPVKPAILVPPAGADKKDIWQAIEDSNEELVRYFVQERPDLLGQPRPGKGGLYPLALAAQKRDLKLTKVIVEGLQALHRATSHPNFDINVRDAQGMTALLYAIDKDASKVVSFLLQTENGADPTAKGPPKKSNLPWRKEFYGNAMDFAIAKNHAACVRALLAWNKEFRDGTAFDISQVQAAAKKRETKEAVELFIKSTKITRPNMMVTAHRLRNPDGRNAPPV